MEEREHRMDQDSKRTAEREGRNAKIHLHYPMGLSSWKIWQKEVIKIKRQEGAAQTNNTYYYKRVFLFN